MKNILVLGLLFFYWSAYSGPNEANRKVMAECRFALSVKLAPKLNNGLVPTLKKFHFSDKSRINFFDITSKTGQASIFFPPAGIFLPFAVIADILISPVTAVRKIVERREIKKNLKVAEDKFINDTKAFKEEWEKIEPNRFKRLQLINELYVFQIESDVHQHLVDGGDGTVETRDNYEFILPYIYKALGQTPKYDKKEREWKIKSVKHGEINLYRYFHLEDFQQILKENPRLCSSPGLDALELIGNGYAKIIREKMNRY